MWLALSLGVVLVGDGCIPRLKDRFYRFCFTTYYVVELSCDASGVKKEEIRVSEFTNDWVVWDDEGCVELLERLGCCEGCTFVFRYEVIIRHGGWSGSTFYRDGKEYTFLDASGNVVEVEEVKRQ